MNLTDLKVESASVNVSNAGQADAKYKISANFATKSGKLTRIDSGNVNLKESGESVASFHKDVEYGNSYSVTYVGTAYDDKEMQCEINSLIHDFIDVAETKAYSEIND